MTVPGLGGSDSGFENKRGPETRRQRLQFVSPKIPATVVPIFAVTDSNFLKMNDLDLRLTFADGCNILLKNEHSILKYVLAVASSNG